MDGVVIDTRAPIEAFWNRAAAECGVTLTPEIMERKIHGSPARQTVYTLFPHLTDARKKELLEACETFEENLQYVPIAGVLELLTSLKRHQIPRALVTSSLPPKVKKVFAQLELETAFDTVVTADLVERGKPDPACYRLAARRMGIPAERCVVFEDAVTGVKASTGAGMPTVGVNTGVAEAMLLETGARTVIPDFASVTLLSQPAGFILQINPAFSLTIDKPTVPVT